MNRRSLAALLSLAGLTAAARADHASLVVVKSVNPDRNEIVTESIEYKFVPVQKTVTVNVSGRLETRALTTYEIVTQKEMQTVPIGTSTAYTGAGKKLDTAEAMKRLKPGSVVILGLPGLADKKYAGVFGPDTLLLLSNNPRQGGVSPLPGGTPPIKLPARPLPLPEPAPKR